MTKRSPDEFLRDVEARQRNIVFPDIKVGRGRTETRQDTRRYSNFDISYVGKQRHRGQFTQLTKKGRSS